MPGWGSTTEKTIGIQIITGYKVSPYFSFGFGVGLTKYSTYIIDPFLKYSYIDLFRGGHLQTPLFLDLRISFLNKSITPFIVFDAGYSIPYDSGDHSGFFVNPSIGIKYFIMPGTSMNISVGYHRYYSNSFILSAGRDDAIANEIFDLLSLKVGFSL